MPATCTGRGEGGNTLLSPTSQPAWCPPLVTEQGVRRRQRRGQLQLVVRVVLVHLRTAPRVPSTSVSAHHLGRHRGPPCRARRPPWATLPSPAPPLGHPRLPRVPCMQAARARGRGRWTLLGSCSVAWRRPPRDTRGGAVTPSQPNAQMPLTRSPARGRAPGRSSGAASSSAEARTCAQRGQQLWAAAGAWRAGRLYGGTRFHELRNWQQEG